MNPLEFMLALLLLSCLAGVIVWAGLSEDE